MNNQDLLDDLPVVTETSKEYLNPRQLKDYRAQREGCLTWLLTFGKNPEQVDGYAVETVRARAYRMDMFYRWVWNQDGGYTSNSNVSSSEGGLVVIYFSECLGD